MPTEQSGQPQGKREPRSCSVNAVALTGFCNPYKAPVQFLRRNRGIGKRCASLVPRCSRRTGHRAIEAQSGPSLCTARSLHRRHDTKGGRVLRQVSSAGPHAFSG